MRTNHASNIQYVTAIDCPAIWKHFWHYGSNTRKPRLLRSLQICRRIHSIQRRRSHDQQPTATRPTRKPKTAHHRPKRHNYPRPKQPEQPSPPPTIHRPRQPPPTNQPRLQQHHPRNRQPRLQNRHPPQRPPAPSRGPRLPPAENGTGTGYHPA